MKTLRILIAWELGSNWGHLATLLPLSTQLRNAGHSVLFAIRGLDGDLSLLHGKLAHTSFDYVAYPVAIAPLQQRHQQPVHSYADVLACCGFDHARTLTQLTHAWQSLLRMIQPDVVVCKYAPLAEFATRSCPVVTIGTGFELPPLTTPLPCYDKASPSPLLEENILHAMRAAAQLGNFAPPATVAAGFAHAYRLCLSTSNLDHFGARAAMHYLGPAEDLPARQSLSEVLPVAAHAKPLCFVYLRLGAPWLQAFVEAITAQFCAPLSTTSSTHALNRHWLVVDPSLSHTQCFALSCAHITAVNQAVAWGSDPARQPDSVVCHGGHGMVAQTLGLGLRLMLLPQHTEQLMLARRVAATYPQGLAVAPVTLTPAKLVQVMAQWLSLPVSAPPGQQLKQEINPIHAIAGFIVATATQRPLYTSTPYTLPRFTQLEITTRCNFSCFYCAGRDMQQQDMTWETFTNIIDALPLHHPLSQPTTVSLQGEGEPSLHPQFWEMVDYVRHKGHVPYTIVNGSRLDPVRIAHSFPRIGISLDTLDPAVAEKIGRHNLSKVLANLEALCMAMGPQRIVVMTVNLGQPLDDLRTWVKQRGFGDHIVQPLRGKQDYAKRYGRHTTQPDAPPIVAPPPSRQPQTCRFLQQDRMRYYTWDGQELPCSFIKDTQGIPSVTGLRTMLSEGHVPPGCAGCRELKLLNPAP